MAHSLVVLQICWFRACGLLHDDNVTILMFPVQLGIFNSGVSVLERLLLSVFQSVLLLTLGIRQCEWLISSDLGLW